MPSDQSASMGRSDSENEEPDTSFLDEDFLSFAAVVNGGSEANGDLNGRKRSRSPVPDNNCNGRYENVAVPWLDRDSRSNSQQQRGYDGRGYYEPPPLIKLHNEIVSFVKLMEPTREELKVRDLMVKRVSDLAVKTFGKKVSFL